MGMFALIFNHIVVIGNESKANLKVQRKEVPDLI